MLNRILIQFLHTLYGRTGKNKLAKFATMVYFKANGIPQFRSKLPFVDQSWNCAV